MQPQLKVSAYSQPSADASVAAAVLPTTYALPAGGQVAQWHRLIEQSFGQPILRPTHWGERLVAGCSRLAGPVSFAAALGGLFWWALAL